MDRDTAVELDSRPPDIALDEWLRKNSTFPEDSTTVPTNIEVHFRAQHSLPPKIATQSFPDPLLPVKDLLAYTLPTQRVALVTSSTDRCYSSLPANTPAEVLSRRKIPGAPLIEQLRKKLYNAIIQGANSVIDPAYPDARLPLWAVDYWFKMSQTIAAQTVWSCALRWLKNITRPHRFTALFAEAEESLSELPWNAPTVNVLHVDCVSPGILARLLTDEMLPTDILDMMVESLSTRLSALEPARPVIIASLSFSRQLALARKEGNCDRKTLRQLHRVKEQIYDLQARIRWPRLWFPVYDPDQQHGFVILVDFLRREVSYGDSLGPRHHLPKEALKDVQAWLEHIVQQPFKEKRGIIKHGIQKDATSCLVVTANAIAHDVLGDPIWSVETRFVERVRWFKTLANAYLETRQCDKEYAQMDGETSDHEHLACNEHTRGDWEMRDGHSRHAPPPTPPAQSAHTHEVPTCRVPEPRSPNLVRHGPVSSDDCPPAMHIQRDVYANGDRQHTGIPATSREAAGRASSLAFILNDVRSGYSTSPAPSSRGSSPPSSIFDDAHTTEPRGSVQPATVRDSGSPTHPPSPAASDFDVPMYNPDDYPVPEYYAPTSDLGAQISSPNCKYMASDHVIQPCMSKKRSRSPSPDLTKTPVTKSTIRSFDTCTVPSTKRTKHSISSMSSSSRLGTTQQQPCLTPRTASTSTGGAIGISKSATNTREVKARVQANKSAGTKSSTEKQIATFLSKVQALDPGAEVSDCRSEVRCSRCNRWQRMQAPGYKAHFERHIAKCTGGSKTKQAESAMKAAHRPLDLSVNGTWRTHAKNHPPKPPILRPCSGLSKREDRRIPQYTLRAAIGGGGGRDRILLASEMFKGREWSELKETEKRQVYTKQRQTWQWRVEPEEGRVYSTTCKQTVDASFDPDHPPPCSSCRALLRLGEFHTILNVPMPKDTNMKYQNKRYTPEARGLIYARIKGVQAIMKDIDSAKETPCLRYALGVLSGQFKEDNVFAGIMHAVVQKQDKEARGVMMNNMKYLPAWDEMASILHAISPAGYRALRDHLPMRSERSIRANEARIPRFPLGLCDRTFELAREHLVKLNYDGPVGLACDDTKLLPALRPYFDRERDAYCILGSTGEPLIVPDPDEFEKVVREGKVEKASKIRVWCMQVTMPKAAGIVVAALAISNKMKAPALCDFSERVIRGLIAQKIKLVGYACDGTQVERNVQRELRTRADDVILHKIPHPEHGRLPIEIAILIFDGQAVVMIQDSKHALKTCRNNLFSGARLLVLGNYVAMYSQVRGVAFADGPLFHRDVEKLDRQDDNAATRLFSAEMLDWLRENDPELLGLFLYLFVFGEMIDMWQNRKIGHLERIKVALRTLFFMELWEQFLDSAGYNKDQHFLSREAQDIIRILIHSLIALVIVYRDHLPHDKGPYPLLLWLLSSEVCEHVFGICRRMIKDFTMLDFYNMVPKLLIQIRQAVLRSHHDDGKSQAAGYNHTYTDLRDINLDVLAMFPTDLDIFRAAEHGYAEAKALFALLGVYPARRSETTLPGIRSWFNDVSDPTPGKEEIDDDAEDYTDEDSQSDTDGDDEDYENAIKLQELVTVASEMTGLTSREETEVNNLVFALYALEAEDSATILAMSEEETSETTYEAEAAQIQTALKAANRLPALNLDDDRPDSLEVYEPDFSKENMVETRRGHQTKQAEKGVRTRRGAAVANAAQTHRVELMRKFADVVRRGEERGIGTGAERELRWWHSAPGGRGGGMSAASTADLAAGTAANAAEVATVVASKNLKKRANAFKKTDVVDPTRGHLLNARVTAIKPLSAHAVENSFGFVLLKDQIWLAQVLSLYSKGGGKNAKHAWVSDSANIAALSNIPVQAFQYMQAQSFLVIPTYLQSLCAKQFALLPPAAFLVMLSHAPKLQGPFVEISPHDLALFRSLQRGCPSIISSVKLLTKRKKGTAQADEEEDVE